MTGVNVKQLIEFLQTFPQDLPVAYRVYSEQALLEVGNIEVKSLCLPRSDGWVADARPDKEQQDYLVFPGN